MTEWWHGLGPVESAGPAGAVEHRLEWRVGDLRLLAHPDPDAEAALGALGGDRCPCLDLLDAWRADHATGSCLVIGGRRSGERLAAPAAAVHALAADLARWRGARATLVADARAEGNGDVVDRLLALRSPQEEEAQRRLGALLLLGLDEHVRFRHQASVAAALAARHDDHAVAALTAATAARAVGPLRELGWQGDLADIRLGADPQLTATRAVLPPSWTAAVWGRDVATTPAGELVLDVTSVTPEGDLSVRAAAPGKAEVVFRVVEWENA